MFHILIDYSSQLDDLFSICNFSGKTKLSTFPIQIILSISKNNSILYLIKIKLVQELVDRCSSVNPSKRKFTNN